VAGPEDVQLIERHVAAFNDGVRTGDWEPMLAGLAPDAEFRFPGMSFVGIDGIRAAYLERGPDDEIVLGGIDGTVAAFAWKQGGTGTMRFELVDGRVARLTVEFDEG
jgi:hypothetical protein